MDCIINRLQKYFSKVLNKPVEFTKEYDLDIVRYNTKSFTLEELAKVTNQQIKTHDFYARYTNLDCDDENSKFGKFIVDDCLKILMHPNCIINKDYAITEHPYQTILSENYGLYLVIQDRDFIEDGLIIRKSYLIQKSPTISGVNNIFLKDFPDNKLVYISEFNQYFKTQHIESDDDVIMMSAPMRKACGIAINAKLSLTIKEVPEKTCSEAIHITFTPRNLERQAPTLEEVKSQLIGLPIQNKFCYNISLNGCMYEIFIEEQLDGYVFSSENQLIINREDIQ